jgi:Tol biopolymer transport system component
MPDSANPYRPGQPASDPKLFFGRRDLLTSIREQLMKGRRGFVVLGAARIGKTSLLRQLPAFLPEEFLAALVELREENAQRLDWLLWRIAVAVSKQVGRNLGSELAEPAWSDFEADTGRLLDRFWPEVRALLGDRCLVLVLDDLDSLAEVEGDLLGRLADILGTWRERDENVAVVVSADPIWQEKLTREYPRLFGGALNYVLGPLNSEEASRLITWPVDGVLTYDYGVARRMIEITSGQPYYLQFLCFEVFNRCAPAGWVNQRDVDLVMEDLVGREIPDFRQVWDESSPPEQAVLAALVSLRGARGVATAQEVRTLLSKAGARTEREQVAGALDSLAARGILERLGALSYRFRVALLRDWLCERIDLEEVVRGTRWGTAGRGRSAGERPVAMLRPRKRSLKVAPRPGRAAAEAAEGETERAPARPRLWLWILLGLVLIVALGLLLRFTVFQPAVEGPTPTAVSRAAATSRLATTTPTPVALATGQTVPVGQTVPIGQTEPAGQTAAAVPSDTPVPSPASTLTPSPTPPIIVARSVPSIAYQSREPADRRWYVYVMDSNGSNRQRLIEGQSGFLSAPSWSPDGSQITFVSDRDGNPDVWVMNSDGSEAVNITNEDAKDHSPAWSPDGEWIAFASVRDSLYWELYIMRPDGSDVQRLTWWEDASDLSPTWSPDGTRLAFASKRDGNWEIYTMDRDGSNLVRLTDDPADDDNPAWSPDGSRIAFSSTRDGFAEIYVMPVVGGQAVNVSNAPFSTEHGPTWSPDGGRIAFYSDRDGEWDIYVMASDGSDVVKLTGDNSNDQVPAWRP